jgi:hypothetical protein
MFSGSTWTSPRQLTPGIFGVLHSWTSVGIDITATTMVATLKPGGKKNRRSRESGAAICQGPEGWAELKRQISSA